MCELDIVGRGSSVKSWVFTADGKGLGVFTSGLGESFDSCSRLFVGSPSC